MEKNNKNILQIITIVIIILAISAMFIFSNQQKDDLKILTETEIKNTTESAIKDFLIGSDSKLEINEVILDGYLYKITSKLDGQEQSPIYMTKDGKKLILQLIDLDELKAKKEKAAADAKVLKSDKPVVELFVMSYCPFGTQFEKGYLPAVEKLGDKIDTKVKFVNYIMHEQKEADENVRQYCIGKNEPTKFNSYLACFLEKGESEDCQTKNKIDKNKLAKCVEDTNHKFTVNEKIKDKDSWLSGRYPQFMIHDELNTKYGVQGSPTLIINGKKVQPKGRDPQSILDSICSAFNNPPAECAEKISNKAPSAGFGYGENDSQTTASCGA